MEPVEAVVVQMPPYLSLVTSYVIRDVSLLKNQIYIYMAECHVRGALEEESGGVLSKQTWSDDDRTCWGGLRPPRPHLLLK